MADTKIPWCDKVWNSVTGCTPISAGCQNCYAKRMANRLRGRYGYPADDPFRITLHPEKLDEPLKWRKAQRVFVNSMSDLFHDDVPTDFIWKVFSTMLEAKQHLFIVLTKRSKRMKSVLNEMVVASGKKLPKNVIGMVTIENQAQEHRIVDLLQTPFQLRGVSVEPMLSAVNLIPTGALGCDCEDEERCSGKCNFYKNSIDNKQIDWVIAGPETGPKKRPMDSKWIRDLYLQCEGAGVSFFDKKNILGLNLQQFPEVTK